MKLLNWTVPLFALLTVGCSEGAVVSGEGEIAQLEQGLAAPYLLFNGQDLEVDLLKGFRLKLWANIQFLGNDFQTGEDTIVIEYVGQKQDISGAVLISDGPVIIDTIDVVRDPALPEDDVGKVFQYKIDLNHAAFKFSPFADAYGAIRIRTLNGANFSATVKENKKSIFPLTYNDPIFDDEIPLQGNRYKIPYLAEKGTKLTDMSVLVTLVRTQFPGDTSCNVTVSNESTPAGQDISVDVLPNYTVQFKTDELGWDLSDGGWISVSANDGCRLNVSGVINRGSKPYRARPIGAYVP